MCTMGEKTWDFVQHVRWFLSLSARQKKGFAAQILDDLDAVVESKICHEATLVSAASMNFTQVKFSIRSHFSIFSAPNQWTSEFCWSPYIAYLVFNELNPNISPGFSMVFIHHGHHQGSMPMEYVPSVTLQLWDGAEWRSEDRRCRRPKVVFCWWKNGGIHGDYSSGWCFGTCFIFHESYMGCHPSHWLSYFSEG